MTPAAEWRSGDESKAVEDKIKGLVSRAPKSLFQLAQSMYPLEGLLSQSIQPHEFAGKVRYPQIRTLKSRPWEAQPAQRPTWILSAARNPHRCATDRARA